MPGAGEFGSSFETARTETGNKDCVTPGHELAILPLFRTPYAIVFYCHEKRCCSILIGLHLRLAGLR